MTCMRKLNALIKLIVLALALLALASGLSVAQTGTAKDAAALSVPAYAAGGGTAQAQTVTLSPAPPYLTAGLRVVWVPTAVNTESGPTLAVNSLAATAITKCGATALVASDLVTTVVAEAIYDGTEFQLLNPQAAPCSGSSSAVNSAGVGYFLSAGVPTMTGITVGSGTSTPAATTVYTCQFALSSTWSIGHAAIYVVTGTASTTGNAGIYNSSGTKLIDTGAMSLATSSNAVSASFSDVTLPPAIYYFAWAATSTTPTVNIIVIPGMTSSNTTLYKVTTKCGTAANVLASGSLPSTLGTITAATNFVPLVVWEY